MTKFSQEKALEDIMVIRGTSYSDQSKATIAGDDDEVYRIGDLAQEFDVTLRTLRFYEDKGLLKPQRNGTTRLYTNSDRARLELILFSKKIGFSLVEIRSILQACDESPNIQNPLASLKTRFQEKLVTLNAQKAEIEEAIDELTSQLASEDGMFAE